MVQDLHHPVSKRFDIPQRVTVFPGPGQGFLHGIRAVFLIGEHRPAYPVKQALDFEHFRFKGLNVHRIPPLVWILAQVPQQKRGTSIKSF
jgi:hypothetical protein